MKENHSGKVGVITDETPYYMTGQVDLTKKPMGLDEEKPVEYFVFLVKLNDGNEISASEDQLEKIE